MTLNRHRRADWKWNTDRAAVASRWTWLQAQVSDLEYRIRQQSEIFKQIRHAKGSVVLGDPPSLEEIGARLRQARANGQKLSPFETKIADIDIKAESNGSPCNISSLLQNVNQQATKLTQSLGNCLTPDPSEKVKNMNNTKMLNGVIPGHSSESATSVPGSSGLTTGPAGDSSSVLTPDVSPTFPFLDATCMAARCRPVRSYRKRKLLRTSGLHQISRKAARLSTVKCHCNPPASSCPMCGGRYNNTQALDPNVMSLQEKVALLDPAYHPVLSFKGGKAYMLWSFMLLIKLYIKCSVLYKFILNSTSYYCSIPNAGCFFSTDCVLWGVVDHIFCYIEFNMFAINRGWILC